MAFYDKFELLCGKKRVTPTQAARDNGITQQAVSLWKTRGSTPKVGTIQKLADYFGVSVEYLLSLTPDESGFPQYVEDAVKATGASRDELLQSFVDTLNSLNSYGYNDAVDAADAAVVEKFEGIPDSELLEQICLDFKVMNRRGRIELAMASVAITENYRFKGHSENKVKDPTLAEPPQETAEGDE